ncbi:MAG: hypothetical protein R3290_06910 [Acidimicrobiia bacterium]|nr:hypothetical protein [Acidimicrobiia bacterium]
MAGEFDVEAVAWTARDPLPPAEVERLDGLLDGAVWDGPLVVSMPRTGSTLLATLFLLLRDPPGTGDHVFARYLHEPVAPMFWEGRSVDDVVAWIGRLTSQDVVQESAYQFRDREIARWFLHRARRPVAFAMRDPRRAWPSRWRILLRMRLAAGVPDAQAERFRRALETDDFSHLGDVLVHEVDPPGNGWAEWLDLLALCREEGIDHVLVDHGGLRDDPETVLAGLCDRWDLRYDPAMVRWDDLTEAIPRVVMSDLATGPEFEWYYESTLSSRGGIRRSRAGTLPLEAFPDELRGSRRRVLTIDDALASYRDLLERGDVAGGGGP